MINKYMVPDLNDLAAVIYSWARRTGFYDADAVRDFDGQLMNVVTEVAEAQEEWRGGRDFRERYWTVKLGPEDEEVREALRVIDGRLQVRNYAHDFDRNEPEWLVVTPELLRRTPGMIRYLKPEGIPSELADIIIRVLDICGHHRIDISAAIADKMAYNETREYRHGNKRS